MSLSLVSAARRVSMSCSILKRLRLGNSFSSPMVGSYSIYLSFKAGDRIARRAFFARLMVSKHGFLGLLSLNMLLKTERIFEYLISLASILTKYGSKYLLQRVCAV